MKDISKIKLAVDTNIWIYLLDKKSPFHNQARKAFAKAEKEGWGIVVAQQNLMELIEVLLGWYGFSPKEAVKKARLIANRNITVIQPLPQTLQTYFNLAKDCLKKNNNFDLYLAATLLDNGIINLVTNDKKDFRGIKNLCVFLLEEFA